MGALPLLDHRDGNARTHSQPQSGRTGPLFAFEDRPFSGGQGVRHGSLRHLGQSRRPALHRAIIRRRMVSFRAKEVYGSPGSRKGGGRCGARILACRVAIPGDIESRSGRRSQRAASRPFSPPASASPVAARSRRDRRESRLFLAAMRAKTIQGDTLLPGPCQSPSPTKTLDTLAILKGEDREDRHHAQLRKK